MLSHELRGRLDELQIRATLLIQRRGHTDDDRIGLVQSARLARGFEAFGLGEGPEQVVAEVLEIGLSPMQRFDLCLIDIKAQDVQAGIMQGPRHGQADIPQPDDSDRRGLLIEPLCEQSCLLGQEDLGRCVLQ